MPSTRTIDNRNMEYLRADKAPYIAMSTLTGGLLAMSRFKCDMAGHGLSDDHVKEDAFMLSSQLRDYQGGLWLDGERLDFAGSKKGNFTLYDYSRSWRADLQTPFDCVNFHISRRALNSLDDEIGSARLDSFDIAPGADTSDPIVESIVSALVPIFDGFCEANQLLLDYIGTGLLIHLASTYGTSRQRARLSRGGLTPTQLNRAKMLIDANLNGQLTLTDIATECGLSSSYFARAFKMSTGGTPHRWLAQRRIEKAIDLLKNSQLSIKEIASACGFSDQAHFTRAFGEAKGVPPAAWRRNAPPAPTMGLYPISTKFRSAK
ncbi:helix-turn-helix domain-containing protein [Agrobacterium tumefaciens]|uniref:helix-turn-helix domain-containing protein n=1 Tax=Agrobacterium tumefaciens TaxID=358 RepID=UPI001F1B5B1D|nr:AraC family transcriptional regulator [Agrobacterium tumefaciens]WCK68801.1 AraC family transcriptional regulator [Agrobacterium tumefaciens]